MGRIFARYDSTFSLLLLHNIDALGILTCTAILYDPTAGYKYE
jgi:hypothetical protein